MTPQELKNSILQRAIQGKLVEQRSEEGTAEELYQQIQAEKQSLMKAGKIKKEKPLPEIAEEEKLFDIPESWKWCYVGELFSHNTGKAMNASAKKVDKSGSIRKFITTSNLYWNTFDFSTVKEMFFSDDELERYTIKKGDLLMNEGGAYFGRTAIWNYDYDICFQNHVHRLRAYRELELLYFYHVFYFYRNMNMMRAKGTAMPGLSSDTLHNMIIPLPPLAEQKRIVAKIEELLPLIDRYEAAYTRMEEFNKRFPGDMQKSLLQMAIQGKLVEQRPEEGTGEELYTQIQAEKQALIKAGKIKKDKPLPEITEDEKPFDIPGSWKWVRIGDIFCVGTGTTPSKTETKFYVNGMIPWVNSSLTSKRYIDEVETYVTQYAVENTSLSIYPAHTLIIAMYGQGKTRGQISELLIPATVNQACAALVNFSREPILTNYVYYFFLFNYEIIRKKAEGTSQPNLNVQKVKETIIPVPPLSEQKRIVAKLEELLPLCERLK